MPHDAPNLKGKRRLRAKLAAMLIRGLALVALAISGYLAYVSFEGGTVVGCGGLASADCDHVLKSRWARVLGVPVAAPAVVVYGSIFLLSCIVPHTEGRTKAIAETLLLAAGLAAIGAAGYFFFLQIAVIGKLCVLCLAVHTCGLIVGALIVYPAFHYRTIDHSRLTGSYGSVALGISRKRTAPAPAPVGPHPNKLLAVAASLLGLCLLITAQLLFQPASFEVVELDTTGDGGVSEDNGTQRNGGIGQDDDWPRTTSDTTPRRTLRPVLPEDPGPETNDSRGGPAERSPEAGPSPDAGQRRPGTTTPGSTSFDGALGNMRPQFERYRKLPGSSRPVDLDIRPRLGFRSAEKAVFKVFDYTCHHCRDMHTPLDRAQDRYGNQLAVVLLPMPLDTECNKAILDQHPDHQQACRYAKLALAVWATKPAEFAEYHDWLMHGKKVPPLSEASKKAVAIGGRDAIRAAINDPATERQLQENIAVFGAIRRLQGGRGLPMLLVGGRVVFGVLSAERLYPILETHLNLQPPIR